VQSTAVKSTAVKSTVERVCFLGRVQPSRLAEYRERHGAVWPELAEFLTDLDGLPPDQGFRRVAEVFHLE